MSTISYQPTQQNSEKANEHEEQIWLEHQQQLRGEGQHIYAWKLRKNVDSGRLVNVLIQTQKQLPGANLIYDYDDETGLIRRSVSELPVVALQYVRYEQQAIDVLLEEKETPFDLARRTPLHFKVFIGEHDYILGMIIHDILLVSLDIYEIMQVISSRYHGESFSEHSVLMPPGRNYPCRDSHLILCCGMREEHYSGKRSSGTRFRAPLPMKCNDEIFTLIEWTSKFALTLSKMTGNARVTLSFEGKLFQQNANIPLTLNCDGKSDAELMTLIYCYLRGDDKLPMETDEGVPLQVQWIPANLPGLYLENETCESLLLPPGHTVWPLTVVFSGHLQVEIVAGAQLAGWVGEYLLFHSLDSQVTSFSKQEPQTTMQHTSDCAPTELVIQKLILEAFREALAMPDMGEHDDFFDYGGHSLIATRVIGRLKSQHGIEININDLFSYPNAVQLAVYARSEDQFPAVPETERLYTYHWQAPLSLAQKSLWKIYKALGFSNAFNIPFALRFLDSIDENVFRQAFTDILVRHSGLRCVFVDIAGEIYQQVIPPEMLSQYDWFHNGQQTVPIEVALKHAADYHFELNNELPIRVTFLKDENNEQQVISLLFHHIVLDEWSVNILMDELAQAVESRSGGMAPVWRQSPVPYHAFALQQSQAGLNEQHLRFWLERLRGVVPAIPIFVSNEDKGEPSDSRGGWVEFKVEHTVSQGLYQLAKQQGASLFNVVYGGIAVALHLLGGMRELVIGTSASGRNDAQFFDTIGYFTTVVAHRIIFDDIPTLNALINEVKRQINDSMPYTDIPVDLVEEALFGDNLALDSHMFEVFIQIHAKNKLNGVFRLADGRDVRFRQVDPEKTESVLGLQFEVMEEQIAGESDVRVMMSYRSDHYSPAQVEQITRTTLQIFAAMAASAGGPDVKIDSLRACIATSGQ